MSKIIELRKKYIELSGISNIHFNAELELKKVVEEINREETKKKRIVYFYTCPEGMPTPPSYNDYKAIKKGDSDLFSFDFIDDNKIAYHWFLDAFFSLFKEEKAKREIYILHISAHGAIFNDNKFLLFRDNDGQQYRVSVNDFTSWIKKIKEDFSISIHCILISACHSDEFAKSILPYCKYSIGMKTKLRISDAEKFSEGFYSKIFMNQSIHDAFSLGALPNMGKIPDDESNYPVEIPKLYKNI